MQRRGDFRQCGWHNPRHGYRTDRSRQRDYDRGGADSGVVLHSSLSAGDQQTVFNAGADAVKVYPPSGMKINALSTNAAMLLAVNTGCLFKCVSSTRVFGVLSA